MYLQGKERKYIDMTDALLELLEMGADFTSDTMALAGFSEEEIVLIFSEENAWQTNSKVV